MSLVLVALGGAAGALSRYVLETWVAARVPSPFPFGTMVVNVSGAFALGLLFALTVEHDVLPASLRLPVMIGFIGAYTTFSTLMLDTWRLVEGGLPWLAVANAVGSVVVGLVMLIAGLAVGRALA